MNLQQRAQRRRSMYTSSREGSDNEDEFMMYIPTVLKVPTTKKLFFGRRKNVEHWDTFKRKYRTDSFRSMSKLSIMAKVFHVGG